MGQGSTLIPRAQPASEIRAVLNDAMSRKPGSNTSDHIESPPEPSLGQNIRSLRMHARVGAARRAHVCARAGIRKHLHAPADTLFTYTLFMRLGSGVK